MAVIARIGSETEDWQHAFARLLCAIDALPAPHMRVRLRHAVALAYRRRDAATLIGLEEQVAGMAEGLASWSRVEELRGLVPLIRA